MNISILNISIIYIYIRLIVIIVIRLIKQLFKTAFII